MNKYSRTTTRMSHEEERGKRVRSWKNGLDGLPPAPKAVRRELITPNPKLKLMEQVREVLRLKHYAIRTERCYCDWIKRYIHFHHMKLRDDLFAGPDAKIEEFLSDLAVRGPGSRLDSESGL